MGHTGIARECFAQRGNRTRSPHFKRELSGGSMSHDMNTSTNMDDAKAAWEKVQEYSWDYLAVINFGHYIANYAWNDLVKGLNNYSGLYFWNAGYVE